MRDASHAERLYDNGNILTEMLLSSEIKGFVPNPGWYFESDDDYHRSALDLLMLTQGWRRFRWQEMAVSDNWELIHPAEKFQILSGRVTNPIGEGSTDSQLDNSLGDGTLKREVRVHAEVLPVEKMDRAVYEDTTSDKGRFRLTIPGFYGYGILFLSAVDTTTWQKGRPYTWVEVEPEEEDRFAKLRYRIRFTYTDIRDLRVCLDFPYPRFVKPYNHYQTLLMPSSEPTDNPFAISNLTQMKTVDVYSKNNGKRRFSDNSAVFSKDAYEAYNEAYDAGMIAIGKTGAYGYARMLVGDMGLDYPFVQNIGEGGTSSRDSKINIRYGVSVYHRMLEDSIPEDSLYSLKYLHSLKEIDNLPPYEVKEYNHLYSLDRYVLYTDYMPRLEGDERYRGDNLPDVDIVIYPYPDGSRRLTYRDRRLIISGFSIADDFYHPNYSIRPLPEVKDYRRTLYWNPDLKLDENGKAVINFFNNSQETSLSISINGMDTNGNLITY